MTNPLTFTATLPAWLPSYATAPDLLKAMRAGHDTWIVRTLHYTDSDMGSGSDPWARIGEATITVTMLPADDIIAAQVKALQAELDRERAQWLTKQSAILERISKLQALPAPDAPEPALREWDPPDPKAEARDFPPGARVRYVPGVAMGDPEHEACEDGVVVSANETVVFVRYGDETTPKATSPTDLACPAIPL